MHRFKWTGMEIISAIDKQVTWSSKFIAQIIQSKTGSKNRVKVWSSFSNSYGLRHLFCQSFPWFAKTDYSPIRQVKYQKAFCISEEQGDLKGRTVKFQVHLFQPQFPKVSQSTADQNSALLPRCAVAFLWTTPSHITRSSLAPTLHPASPDFQLLCIIIIISAPSGLSQPCSPLLTAPTPSSQAWSSLDHCIMMVLFGLQVIHLLRPPAGWCLINCIPH